MTTTYERGADAPQTTDPKPAAKKAKSKKAPEQPAAAAQEPASELQPEQEPQPEKTAKKPAKATKKAKGPALALTLQELAERYIQHLYGAGKSHGTCFSYSMELKTALRELGEKTLIHKLSVSQVEAFYNSPAVTQLKSGKPKAKPSIDKTRRVLRLALCWAVEQGWIPEAPLPTSK